MASTGLPIPLAARVLKQAEAVLITAGAGMGVDSGLPDFRGNEGFWKAYPPIAALGISFAEMANPVWFTRDPRLAWAFYGHRLNLYRRTRPHRGFFELLSIVEQKQGKYFVFTSNVDGHFQKAGYDHERVVECHGSIHWLQCVVPCCDTIWDAAGISVTVDENNFQARGPLPSCPRCGSLARPNILMFGDWTWIGARSETQALRFGSWLSELADRKMRLVVIEIGAGKAVPTIRLRSEATTRSHDATLVRINPRDWEVPGSPHLSLPVSSRVGIEMLTREYGKF